MTKKRICIDQDDVLADTNGKFVELYLAGDAPRLSLEELQEKSLHELLDADEFKALFGRVYEPGFFSDIRPMPGAVEAVRRLSEQYDIFVATAAMEFPNSFREKYDWLAQHFPLIGWRNTIFLGDKSILRADYLIDDLPRNLKTFQGEGLLFHALHNRDATGYRRFQNWEEITAYLL